MMLKIDKTILVVALTRWIEKADANDLSDMDHIYVSDFQRMLNILTGKKAHLIGQSIPIEDHEFELLEDYLEEV